MRGVLCPEAALCGRRICGSAGEKAGEAVFFTGMTGYEDSVTDPSYCGQIRSFSHRRNGIPPGSGQSAQVWVQGLLSETRGQVLFERMETFSHISSLKISALCYLGLIRVN